MNQDTLILNVDDNDGARYVKTRILLNAGFRVEEAANGTDALLMVTRVEPALVLLDVKLPDINGIEVCRRIKGNPATCDVLVLQTSAALTGRDDKIRGLEGGADNYLAAPIEADELVANVRALLRLQQTRADLKNSEERFRQLAENIDDVFWMFSLTDGALLYVSAAYDAMWGRDSARLAEAPGDWTASVHADDRAALLQRWEGLREHGAYDEEYRVAQPDGAMRWVRDRAFVVKDAMDQPYRIARITSDISGRKAMESRLRAADENKNDFLATLAHELRNPLSPIRTAVELLGRAGPDAVSVQFKARAVITRQVDHLTRLVDDLLDVARISEGKLTLRQEAVELDGVLKAALETAAPVLQARHHQIQVTAPAQPLWVWGDAVRLAQSIGNLLHNAAKFTSPNGAVRLVVEVVSNAMVHITVHDNGIGISAENLPRIFDMFAQGAFAPDRAHDGLGIGLSLVSTLVTMHGGRLTASSAGIGLGSAFTIALPLMPAPAEATPVPRAGGLPGAGSALSILLVDDNVDSAEMMRDLLVALGHTVELAHDGASALALAALRTPDVMILDIGLPDMDGAELARSLRALPALAHTRLVAHTGYGAPHDREKTSDAGFDFHLVKPVAMADLQAALRAT
ncbi:hybrid sensor histidine kinase/response regulator [Massilia eurypsychrophila]|uniref:histidine kinase n=1 Tax=Massilia eurypsychrophila TaxID=1485217 RepID=A0A2G8TFX6_9BURK|nr:response regulator [Massilia eurypsychrophila]PIL44924.1 hybrid sensor histidine kinase/response regulator [Massilia eurypsychrophila]